MRIAITGAAGLVGQNLVPRLKARGGPLWAERERVAQDIVRAAETGHADLYPPWCWPGVMALVRALPRPLFHRTSL